jgi:leucyl/phenylalanyl-tRNA--protein transferase
VKRAEHSIPFLTDKLDFPPAHYANLDGLLAVGGDLSPKRLIKAYNNGIFPWFNDDSIILWWSPDPRMVLFPQELKISRSMQRTMHSGGFSISRNQQFAKVIESCARLPRNGQHGTWITPEMQKAYLELHRMGIAISYETWMDNNLVGGLYGIDLGHVFCGESMFHTETDASKFAFVHLVQDLRASGYKCIDCQVYNPHLASLGARELPRGEFLGYLKGDSERAR